MLRTFPMVVETPGGGASSRAGTAERKSSARRATRCAFDGCEKYPQSGSAPYCRAHFKLITGRPAPPRKKRVASDETGGGPIWERDETVPDKDNWPSPSSFLSATEMRGSLRNNPSVLVL